MRLRRTSTPLPWILLLAAAVTLWAPAAWAFHFPWDQGHDIFEPDHGDDDDPGDDRCEASGSPFDVLTGNFFYSTEDVSWDGSGPAVKLVRTYNSEDRREGPFGLGWTFTFDQRLIEVTDGIEVSTLCRKANGKRSRFQRLPGGGFAPPSAFFAELVRESDGTLTLRERSGVERHFDSAGRLTSIVDRDGDALTISYDETGFPTEIVDSAGRALALTKGPNGRVSSMTDPLGGLHRYEYDTNGRLTRYVDPLDEATDYVYQADGRLRRILDPLGRVVQDLAYDGAGRVVSYLEDGARWTVSHSPAQHRVTKRDAAGNTWTIDYNDNGNVTRRADPAGHAVLTAYDASFRIQSRTDARGGVRSYTYDDRGNLLTETDPLGNVTSYAYEPGTDLPVEIHRADGGVTALSYDARGNLIVATDAEGHVTRYTYDASGNVTQIERGATEIQQFEYDSSGNIAAITGPAGGVTRFTYDALGNPLSVTDPDGYTVQIEYDARGRKTRFLDPAGNATSYTYAVACPVCDGQQRVASMVDPTGVTTQVQWDEFGRRVAATDGSGNSAAWTYDARGNLERFEDASGGVTLYAYDAVGHLSQLTTPDGGITRYTYDAAGNLSTVTDPIGAVSTFTYDLAGRATAVDSADAGATQLAYDAVGNLVEAIDADGNAASYSYDLEGRPTGIGYADTALDVVYRYDETSVSAGAGRFTGYSDPAGDTRLHYRSDGELTRVETSRLGVSYATDYTLTAGGRIESISYPSGLRVDYSFDGRGLVSQVTLTPPGGSAQTVVSQVSYDGSARRSGVAFGNGVQESRAYDAAGRLSALALGGFDQISYTYDAVGRLLAIDDALDPVRDRTLQRDANGRLASAAGPWGGLTFGYDGNGNRTQKSDALGAVSYTYSANRLASIGGAESASYTFDASGRVLSNGSLQFEYGANGRMVRVSNGSGTVANYAYNGFGQRAIKTSAAGTTVYHYDVRGLLIEESDAAGVARISYVYLPDGTPVGRYAQGALEFFHVDHLGTPTRVTDTAGNTTWRIEQRPFGAVHAASGQQNLRFQGQYYDEETGLHYNWNRYYDPATGRYLRADPIGLSGGLNPFVYADNEPTGRVDPAGLFNFVWHYYFGGGTTVNLGSVGLLATFRGAPSVSNAVNDFRNMAANRAQGEASSLCPECAEGVKHGNYNLDNSTVTDVTNVRGLFAVGHSTFFRKADCQVVANCDSRSYSFFCDFKFYIRDWFRDPINIGREVGGTPYRINADWNETSSGSGSF